MAILHVYKWRSLPEYSKIFPIPLFCELSYGDLLYIGMDDKLDEIYVLGCRRLHDNIKNSLLGVQKIFKLDYDRLVFVDTQNLEDKIDMFVMKLIHLGIGKEMFKRYLYNKFREKLKNGEAYDYNL